MNKGFIVIVSVLIENILKENNIVEKLLEEVKCCNCTYVFSNRPKIGDTCPGCKNKIGQIEIL